MTETKVADYLDYSKIAGAHLEKIVRANEGVAQKMIDRIVSGVQSGQSLFVFGSGHSALFPLELYHRAGGASFVMPIVADYLMPQVGPPIARLFERTPGVANALLRRAGPNKGEMLWIASQSGINAAVVDLALEARKMGLFTVAFTSKVHSSAVQSRHSSQKRLFEVCDETIDLGGFVGDACVPIAQGLMAGPLSSIGASAMGHSILVAACAKLERMGHRCVYTSVNTPEGEERNRKMEAVMALRDPLLR